MNLFIRSKILAAAPFLLCLAAMVFQGHATLADEPAKPDPNPPSDVKVKEVKWPGLVSIFQGASWGADENYLVAIQEAGFGAAGASEAQIPECRKHGMKAYVFIWAHEASTIPAKHKDDDAVLCYFLSDRQPPKKWGLWAAWEKNAYAADPYHPAVFTMLGTWGGVDAFCPIVRGRVMEYYHYHWDGNRQPHLHFAILEQYRQASAKAGGVPICRIVETRAEDPRKTRQTVYTSLAYGVRGFRTGGSGLFDTKNRDARGVPKRTNHGEEALKFNQAIKSYSPIFEKARSVDVFHTAPLPAGTKEAPADHWVRPTGDEIVLGEFANPSKERFLVLANRDAFKPHDARLHFTEPGITVQKMDKVSGKWEPLKVETGDKGGTVKVPLEDGGGELLQVISAKK
ncbi:MAG: hypothetical protein K8T25_12705 [Planctomycetia bacterium]|nr:hypothetical protein [Planctomycetia bacterium]